MSLIKKLVDLQLKEAGWNVDYEHVLKNEQEDGLMWFQKYHWKKEEDFLRFKTKAEEIIKKEINGKSKENVRINFNWFDGNWGLSCYYLDFIKNEIDAKTKKWDKKNK